MQIILLITSILVLSSEAKAIFVDGSGHYGLLGEVRTNQMFIESDNRYQAIRQSFSLLAEARYNDRLSLFLELQLFDDPLTNSLLGDQSKQLPCPDEPTDNTDDSDQQPCQSGQDLTYPSYENFKPRIAQLYVRYAFDYCLLEVGRRGRDWGLGIFLDSGEAPFSSQQSIFDGLTCHVNVQKNQTLGFSIGYDSLTETGTNYPPTKNTESVVFGATNNDDDVHQLFFTIEYDDREVADNSGFSRVTGGYFATIFAERHDVSVKFFDLYIALFYKEFLATRHELLFRIGKSADPSWHKLGGKTAIDDEQVVNELNAIAVSGDVAWTFYTKGTEIDVINNLPKAKHKHTLLAGYAITPGDSDGYLLAEEERDTDVTALALHGNFKPALIFYNALATDQTVAGIYHPQQLVNVNLFWLAYHYDNYLWGTVELKLLSGMLREADNNDRQLIGHHGKALGYEVDLHYRYQLHSEVELGLAAAVAFPGKAWQTGDQQPHRSVLLQSSVAFKF